LRSPADGPQQAKLIASDAAMFDWFGRAVALSGNTVVAGATGHDDGGSGSGSAYVFVRTSGPLNQQSVWTQQAKLNASDAATDHEFGKSVALSGNRAVVGAINDSPGGVGGAGSAYVFTRTGGVWTQQAKLTASDASQDDYFGYAVAVRDDIALVGAAYDNLGGIPDAGSAYVYSLNCVPSCHPSADINCDGTVNIVDLLAVIAAWGPCPAPPIPCPADIFPPQTPTQSAGDGVINIDDLVSVFIHWG
jgi:FG-GAP repeat